MEGKKNRFFEIVDQEGKARNDEPYFQEGLDEIIRQQKAIGKNLNRLTVLSNMGKISSVNLQELTEKYASLNKTLTELLDRKRWSA